MSPLSFDERMAVRAARRASPEFLERKARIESRRRHREIWAAIRLHDSLHAKGLHRVRGIGHAAERAGY